MRMLLFIIVILSITAYSKDSKAEVSYRINIGLYSEHYLKDSDELNEENELIILSRVNNGNMISVASFINSYSNKSYMIGYGREITVSDNLRYGALIGVIHGYEGDISTHYRGLVAAPVTYMNYKGLTLNVMPAAFNVGYEFDF